jgi:hypothetical protein
VKVWLAILMVFHLAAAFAQTESPIQFIGINIYVDAGLTPLAAYQLEFKATNGTVKIVGIEGGESPAFKEPPHYDPRAMQQERVVIAAFTTDSADKLPSAKTRVATIHLQVSGDAKPNYTLKLEAAADSNGKTISATATFDIQKTP